MIKRIEVLMLLLLVSWGNIHPQQLSHQVLVPVAGVTSAGAINYSQTIGETAVEIISSPEFVFTQGFQQPGVTVSRENPPPGNGVKVYPNPVTDLINIELFGEASRTFMIDIINISGTVVKSEKLVFATKFWHIKQFNVEQYSNGFYFVKVVSEDGLINRTFKIDKM